MIFIWVLSGYLLSVAICFPFLYAYYYKIVDEENILKLTPKITAIIVSFLPIANITTTLKAVVLWCMLKRISYILKRRLRAGNNSEDVANSINIVVTKLEEGNKLIKLDK